MKKKPDTQQLTIIGIILYGLIMLSLIIMYRDILITITAVVIMAVLVIQYVVPLMRERIALQGMHSARLNRIPYSRKSFLRR